MTARQGTGEICIKELWACPETSFCVFVARNAISGHRKTREHVFPG